MGMGPDGVVTRRQSNVARASDRGGGLSRRVGIDRTTLEPGHGTGEKTMENIITGYEAIQYAKNNGITLNKYADPIEDAREGLTVVEANEVAREDARLIWVTTANPPLGTYEN
jgi:hypothetical protein